MEQPTTKLSAQDRVILFCVATGIDHGSVHITDHASGRATLTAILEGAP